MTLEHELPATNEVPPLVRAILHQVARMRAAEEISQQTFECQLDRLVHEQLKPRGMSLLVRDLPNGCTRFLIKTSRTGVVCDMIDCAP